jgi:hypothetical protein
MGKLLLIITLCAVSTFGQFGFDTPPPPLPDEEIVYCRGTQEVDENGNPVPDDPNCIPDPSIGGNGGVGELISFYIWGK